MDEEKREEEKRKDAEEKRLAIMDELQKGKEANRMRIIHQNEKKREEEKRKDAEAKRLARMDEKRRDEEKRKDEEAKKLARLKQQQIAKERRIMMADMADLVRDINFNDEVTPDTSESITTLSVVQEI